LQFYLENYSGVELFSTAEYTTKVFGVEDFKRANPILVGGDVQDDISYNWFIIATAGNTQYITIDLAKERLGVCYDSFWDRHGVVGAQPIIANSFMELLQALYNNKGECPYWLKDDFQPLGDAYDEQ
jgi:hypothetical protein